VNATDQSAMLGVAIDGAGVRAVVVDPSGRVLGRAAKTAGARGAAAFGRSVRAAIAAAGRAAAVDGMAAAGVAAADPAAPDTVAAAQACQAACAQPAVALVPGAAAALAESWCGAAQGARHVVSLAVGDRIVAGILIDGRPWAGAHGLAASAGWLALNPVERQDYRRLGCLDAEVSADGIARRLVWRIQAGDASGVLERAGGSLEAIAARHVFEGARAGDGVAISVVRDTARYIGMAVANLATIVDPEAIVLGGEVASAGDLLLEPVRQETARRLSPALNAGLCIEVSSLGEDAAAIGAAGFAAARP
jgi:glucokinase